MDAAQHPLTVTQMSSVCLEMRKLLPDVANAIAVDEDEDEEGKGEEANIVELVAVVGLPVVIVTAMELSDEGEVME